MNFSTGRHYIIILLILALAKNITAQEIHGNNQIWLQGNLLHKINDDWKAGLEVHMRFDDYFSKKQLFIFRPFVDYIIAPNVDVTFGYSYSIKFPYGDYPIPEERIENQIFEQLTLKQKLGKVDLLHRYRIEQNFLEAYDSTSMQFAYDDYVLVNRFRYRLTANIQISSKSSIVFFDEIFIAANNDFRKVTYNQNWFSIGYGHTISPSIFLHLNYLYQYARNTPDLYERHHGLYLNTVFKI